jgi:hypothetical protein
MPTTVEVPKDHDNQLMLRQLFDAAAAKSMAFVDKIDAEQEMACFLRAVKAHPELRAFATNLFIAAFADDFYMKWPPWELLQFCMHDLRWPEIRDFVRAKLEEDVEKHGSRSSPVWRHILEAFEDNWEEARFYEYFKSDNH